MLRIALVSLLLHLSGCARPASEEAVATEAPGQSAQETHPDTDAGARTAVIAAVQAVLDAINEADPDLLRAVMLPGARIVATGRGPASSSTVDQMARRLAEPEQRFMERMWGPQVAIDGPIASVWVPYDFYLDGEFSHCGVDAFHLIETDGEWRVQDLIYSVRQPPACTMHPDGPPR
jgi:hypothetical protein